MHRLNINLVKINNSKCFFKHALGLLRRKEQSRLSERNRNQKRRDKKDSILRNGESQRADGRYAFVYTDCFGKTEICLQLEVGIDRSSSGRKKTLPVT